MSVCSEFASFITTARPPHSLAPIVEEAVADCFGCMLAGSGSRVAQRARLGTEALCSGTATLFGTSLTAPPAYAAMINAIAAHAFDLDDWEEPANTHPTVVMLPALLAVAEMQPVSGEEFFAAYAVGFEVIVRLGEAVTLDHYNRGFHSTATLGALGAAASVARLKGLDKVQTAHTLALAASQAVGYTVQFGSNAKPLQAGMAARAGLESAMLAEAGATAQPHVLDGARGFAGLMGDPDPRSFDRVLSRLGRPWALEEHGLLLKPWPSCGYTHRLMTAALELRGACKGRLDAITAIRATLPDFHKQILPFDQPSSANEALFSAQACVAQALHEGGLTLDDLAAEFWRDAEIEGLMDKITVVEEPARNPALNFDPDQPDRLVVSFNNGDEIEARCGHPLGAPQHPMSRDQLAQKYASITVRKTEDFFHLLTWRKSDDICSFFRGAG